MKTICVRYRQAKYLIMILIISSMKYLNTLHIDLQVVSYRHNTYKQNALKDVSVGEWIIDKY